jgi:hypothetical protein
LKYDTGYHWQVAAVSVRGVPTLGDRWCFRTVVAPPECPEQGPPNLRTTGDGCKDDGTITLEWDSVERATAYAAVLQREGDKGRSYVVTSGTSCELQGSSLAPGSYTWWAAAMNEACARPEDGRRSDETGSFEVCGPAGPQFKRGDSNADGSINITDGIFVLNFLFLGGPGPKCRESADPNNDGTINITDGIYILNYLFLGGPAPSEPGPKVCGLDPDAPGSAKDLGCEEYTHCP